VIDLSSQQRTRLSGLATHGPDGQQQSLHASDPDHARTIEELLALSGRTSDRYPALHRDLAAARTASLTAAPAGLDDATVVDIGRDAS
jgi:hypothetical protein